MEKEIYSIYDLLYELGISANYTGFLQTACALELCREDPRRLQQITKWIYPEVARQCGTNWRAVERNIRTVCGVAWRNNRGFLERLGRREFPQEPPNGQFLAILLYRLLEPEPLLISFHGDTM